jgi:uncharacterized protein
MKKVILLMGILCSTLSLSIAQTDIEFDSQKLIGKGVEYHDEEKYAEAIAEFKKVNKNDTNYVLACLELANTYITIDSNQLALDMCLIVEKIPSSYYSNMLILKGNALDNLERPEEAAKVYEAGIKKYPLTNTFYHEMGVLKVRQKKYKEAQEYFIKSIECNPYYMPTHDKMGSMALMQGKIVPAILAWQFYLLLDNSSDRAINIISQIEKIARDEYDYSDAIKVDGLSEQDDFSELEALVKSKAALSNQYKPKIKLNYNITKIFQLIFEKVAVEKGDKGFYMNYYAPLFEAMSKKDYYDVFTYNVLSGVNNKDVDSWLEKHKSETKEFFDWAGTYVVDNFLTRETTINGKVVMARRWYQNKKINSVGVENEKGDNVGHWYYFHPNGEMRSEGAYVADNKRDGLWKYYDETGKLSDEELYKNGELNGAYIEYWPNGNKKVQKNYVNGELDGLQTVYFATGGKSFTYEFSGAKQNGKEIHFHQNDKLMYELPMLDGKVNGFVTQYYKNGNVSEKSTFVNSLRQGKSEDFYSHPANAIKTLANYEKGTLTGELTNYYRNGKIEETGRLNEEGYRVGVWKTFYDDGTLSSEDPYINGKIDGVSKNYDPNGKLTEEFFYKKGILQEYKAYAPNGNIVYQNKKDGKNNYSATLYYSNGVKKREGRVEDGERTGEWIEYNRNGFITSKSNYLEGNKNGKSITYHYNGQIDIETDYEKGETNGYYRKYFTNGKLKMEGAYINDKQIGEWHTYYMNGKLNYKNFYLDGVLEGWQEYYTAHGKLDLAIFYELGYAKKEIMYDTLEQVKQEFLFVNGSGDFLSKYKNGKPEIKFTYKNGLVQGTKLFYFPNGTVKTSKNYEDDELSGESKYYYPNGKVKLVQSFIDGELHGKLIEYYEDGTMMSETEYSYGLREGKSTYYYPNKKVEREYTYKNNETDGKANIYDETGELIIERNYVDGNLVSYSYFDKNGAMVPPIEVKNETGEIKAFYKSGLPSIIYTLKNGYLEGKRISYHSNGKIYEEENYLLGERHGVIKEYYFSGKIRKEENYHYDLLDGKRILYYENGKVKSDENFIMGDHFGLNSYYDQAGVKTKAFIYYNDSILEEK